MKKVINMAVIIMLLLPATACRRRELSAQLYAHYIQDEKNGLKKVIRVADWEYKILYKPYDYIIQLEGLTKDIKERSSRLKNLQGTAWFNVSFRNTTANVSPLRYGVASLEEYNQRLDYFLNHTANNFSLIYNGDTLKPINYLFETNYNLTPQETMVVGFSLPEGEEKAIKNMQLVYHDVMFKNGIIKANYNEEVLNNIPNIVY